MVLTQTIHVRLLIRFKEPLSCALSVYLSFRSSSLSLRLAISHTAFLRLPLYLRLPLNKLLRVCGMWMLQSKFRGYDYDFLIAFYLFYSLSQIAPLS